MTRTILLVLSLVVSNSLLAQNNPVKDFDFWIGTWKTKMSSLPNWEVKTGIDTVSYHLSDRLIEEIFTRTSGDKANFQRGYLMYLFRDKKWKHTIFDGKWGEYTFYGNREGDKVILQSDPSDSRPGLRRETFYNITSDSFNYLWESSRDGGETWIEEWKIEYTRLKE